ncbi:hypothetical protein [Butyrivibrio sp. AE3004]|uniref:hypothetical protein n=1 Tax=Butyrivibrio sp. AE3004 TaxID=1506994 RepID=UPI0004946951|nr:hypothetical protein [Butyrivibrio sp. AE3004]
MSIEEFVDYLINEYEVFSDTKKSLQAHNSCRDFESETTGFFWKQVMSIYSDKMFALPVTRKDAARILYIFYREVLKMPDVDWNRAKNLKDIYECRVCANAIAQMYENGILEAKAEDEFGTQGILTEKELKGSVKTLMSMMN